ncbi:MAG: hypothetical protein ACI9RP_001350 [Cyclobacteriaceae bacterium]|jgi:hypothetical protein
MLAHSRSKRIARWHEIATTIYGSDCFAPEDHHSQCVLLPKKMSASFLGLIESIHFDCQSTSAECQYRN